MPYDRFHLSTSLTLAVACLLAAGCAGPSSRQAAVPQITAETSFADLQAIFHRKFSGSHYMPGGETYKPLSAVAVKDLDKANVAARDDFSTWCKLRAGGLNQAPWRRDSPAEVRAAAQTASNMVYSATSRSTVETETVCTVQGRPYVLHNSYQTYGPTGGSMTRAIAWISPDDLAKFGPLALQAREAEKRKAREQEATAAHLERHKKQAAADERIELLERSPKGKQLLCEGHQSGDASMVFVFDCQGLLVDNSDFGKFGWRIVSQKATPQEMNGVPQGTRIDVVVEKVR